MQLEETSTTPPPSPPPKYESRSELYRITLDRAVQAIEDRDYAIASELVMLLWRLKRDDKLFDVHLLLCSAQQNPNFSQPYQFLPIDEADLPFDLPEPLDSDDIFSAYFSYSLIALNHPIKRPLYLKSALRLASTTWDRLAIMYLQAVGHYLDHKYELAVKVFEQVRLEYDHCGEELCARRCQTCIEVCRHEGLTAAFTNTCQL